MAALLHQLLTADQRQHALLADLRAATALDLYAAARAIKARVGPLGPQHTMNELQRARAGIDHRGQPLPRAGATDDDTPAAAETPVPSTATERPAP